MTNEQTAADAANAGYLFDARGVHRRFRHASIFAALNALTPGERMCFINDHDPLPLLEQIGQHFGDSVGVTYRQREPGVIVIEFEKVN